jgi:putative ABC transport system permease protein
LIRGNAVSRERFDRATQQVRTAMRIRHKLGPGEEDTFGLISTEEINSFVDDFTQVIAGVVVPITLISLVVGGIVVMNIMLVSVTERTFEIGLRKSLGARRRDILNQFLIESFFLGASGGVIGIGFAALVSWIIEMQTPMTMTITMSYVILSVGVAGGIGIIFGIYPAFSASKLDPIEALREDR